MQAQIDAARDLLADPNLSKREVAEKLMSDYDISQATAYRRIEQAESDTLAERTVSRETFDVTEYVLREYVKLVNAAKDPTSKMEALSGLTNAMSKLKRTHLPAD